MIAKALIISMATACCILSLQFPTVSTNHHRFELRMPSVRANQPDMYLCTSAKVNPNSSYYITGFEPVATMKVAHHMLLMGCMEPGLDEPVWNCREMDGEGNKGKHTAQPCKGRSTIIYAWAKDAPAMELPDGVSFKVGENTSISYLVLQLHYSSIEYFKYGLTDSSGIYIDYQDEPTVNEAGVLLLGTGGMIKARTIQNMDVACIIEEDKEIHPFAFRTHTHELGVKVSGYRVRFDENGGEQWTLIGSQDPQLPQMFYKTDNNITLKRGDGVAARCRMESHRYRNTIVGPTAKDEMCNLYIAYWVKGRNSLDMKYCFSPGPPMYKWEDEFHEIPKMELDETDKYRD